MIYHDTTAIEAVNEGRDIPDAFYQPKHPSVLLATRKWHASSAWRGYNEVFAEPGFKSVAEGTNCGGWSDTPAGTNEREVEAELNKLEAKHGTVYVIWTPTSNVFATSFDVLIADASATVNKGKTIARKTRRFEYDNGDWSIRYHATHVVRYNAARNTYTLDTGGWNTMTTAKRMTDALPAGFYVYRRNWVMYVHCPDERGDLEIKDGMEV